MFYSHEILTDRKHGVATIWLVATLGSKSSLKKVTRKAIMGVDVPNACGTITDPSVPMALRLQGNLLYGVSRVFSQQCAYVLTDMQSLRDKMRGAVMALKELEIDPNVVTTRPEQLNLQADPAFNIDLDLGFDLSSFDVSFSTEPSSLLSPRTLPSSQSGFLDDENFLDPAQPFEVSSSHGVGGGFSLGFDDLELGTERDGHRHIDRSHMPGGGGEDDEFAMSDVDQEDNIMEMAEDGSIIMRDVSEQGAILSDPPGGNKALQAEAVQEDGFELVADTGDADLGDMQDPGASSHNDDDIDLINDEPSDPVFQQLPQPQPGSADADVQQSIEEADLNQDEADEAEEVIVGTAPQRATRAKVVPFDDPAELSNQTLAEWNNYYLEFMDSARLETAIKISAAQAKRNAAYWVLDQGLGDVDSNFREDYEEHPLTMFSGQTLIGALVGPLKQFAGRKRSASAIDDDGAGDGSQTSRRVRSRSDEGMHTSQRGDNEVQLMDEGDLGITLGDDDFEAEVGREEQAPLSDQPSDMPWNAYALSRPGSARPGLSVAGASSSAHGRGTFDVNIPSSTMKRVSQLIRESPLDRRRRLARESVLGGSVNRDDTDFGSMGGDLDMNDDELDAQLAGDPNEDFELYGPAADVSTQEAATNQWVAETLEKEAFNFLEFLRTTIQQKERDDDFEMDAGEVTTMTFEDLLPPASNNEIVAAQGLLHVLSLATKGLIDVRQDEAFGDINLSVVGGDAAESEEVDAREEDDDPVQE